MCHIVRKMCYMEQIGVRELRQNASKYLDRVAQGEIIEITNHGEPAARLVPITDDPEWTKLITTGEVEQARRPRTDLIATRDAP